MLAPDWYPNDTDPYAFAYPALIGAVHAIQGTFVEYKALTNQVRNV